VWQVLAQANRQLQCPEIWLEVRLVTVTIKRRAFFSITAGLGIGALAEFTAGCGGPAQPAASYAFADEFDGPAGSPPDPSKWAYDLGGGGWGNNELTVYTASRANSFQDGKGNLVIRATKSESASGGRSTTTYHSARLKTIGKFSTYTGNFEARIKLDVQHGLWPAWWAMGANFNKVGWPSCGEVDMLENYGNSFVQTSVHTPDDARRNVLTKFADTKVDNDWHVWRTNWTANGGFTFYKDGTKYMQVAPRQMRNWCFSSGVPMFMILNAAIGGAAGRPPQTLRFPIDFLVDYVRVW
jgi:beta-glucanase (GH16 family)